MTRKLGINIPTAAVPVDETVALAVLADEGGFDFVSASDHPASTVASNETWTQLTWLAASTTRVKVASRVLGVPFRNPLVVAKMAETLHRLSGGRLILGLGAGGSDEELRAVGAPALEPGQRIDALAEAIHIIRAVWTEPDVTYRGRYHQTDSATIEPRPSSPIPIWLGTFGPRALELTGTTADGWLPTLGYAPEDRLPDMLDRVRSAAEQAGRSRADVEAILNLEVRVQDNTDTDSDALVGPTTHITERLRSLAGLGFDGFNLIIVGPEVTRQLAALAEHVVPSLREEDRPRGRCVT